MNISTVRMINEKIHAMSLLMRFRTLTSMKRASAVCLPRAGMIYISPEVTRTCFQENWQPI